MRGKVWSSLILKLRLTVEGTSDLNYLEVLRYQLLNSSQTDVCNLIKLNNPTTARKIFLSICITRVKKKVIRRW